MFFYMFYDEQQYSPIDTSDPENLFSPELPRIITKKKKVVRVLLKKGKSAGF